MKTYELVVEAVVENLSKVTSFLEDILAETSCSMRTLMQITVAAEEVFVNIASYAYAPDTGNAAIRVEISGEPAVVTIAFADNGIPYDPLAREDPDVTTPAEERDIGGLGILITKKTMDRVSYEYRNGQNILTLKKNL